MASMHEEVVKLRPDAIVHLYQLDTRSIGGPLYHFTSESYNGAKISFGGQEFVCVPVTISGMSISGTGALQAPTITISNTDGIIQEMINAYGNLEGCKLTRWRTFARFLDGGESPDGSVFYGPDVYMIDRKSVDSPTTVEWEMSTLIDHQGIYLGRQVIRDTCMWSYRRYNKDKMEFDYSKTRCPYSGSNYFDENNEPTLLPENDKPSRTIKCCRVRFGEDSILPFGGFPGIQR